ncbi:MAG: urease accessory protein UreE [Verrucomicrobiota bacterium]|nr:urease accessory protein UreE [Verrucomicrobiota bacterium]
MHLVKAPLPHSSTITAGCTVVAIPIDRRTLAKRLWRGRAVDGTEFGFELDKPLSDGDCVLQTDTTSYIIAQLPEPVLEITLTTSASDAALLGWTIGNLHFEIEVHAERVLAPDDIALQQTLDRAGITYRETTAIFHPQRSGGHGHHHGHGLPFLPLPGHRS